MNIFVLVISKSSGRNMEYGVLCYKEYEVAKRYYEKAIKNGYDVDLIERNVLDKANEDDFKK